MDQKAAIAALGALAQDTRLELFRLLVATGPQGLPAGVIAERLGVLPSSLSFHLNQLHHAGLDHTAPAKPAADLCGRIRRDERLSPTSPRIAAVAGNPAHPPAIPPTTS
jgi:predicted transcriptional regulator